MILNQYDFFFLTETSFFIKIKLKVQENYIMRTIKKQKGGSREWNQKIEI